MPTFSELKSRCENAIKGLIPDENEESVSVLSENDWVRILTVCDADTSEKWRIEVEVSLPSHEDPLSRNDVTDFIQNLIKHLEYLLRLDEEGLTLGVMSRDGLWTAYLDIDSLPPDSLFEALIPPSK
jgi:hypothetical protein